ncbi:hypothetical protein Pst134EA_000467 [Puccinia striiformis f. sp. tritici]|uniref:hypothetical protein n=1 Tax=Puccinia striiformis f. sp. tritici TaxID=168172 RepID=UPI002008A659|nr:hypothetical protein Pst134EA_000467 [Puccinia striiformis f. sp. tritici]KAH9473394.1 hypothetical protein Pst134EA_000467 [Puccinia striiformis f. sp. tritici]
MGYMDKNWIPLADRFVKYLISDVLHFKNVNTSRVESLHAAIERFLKGANSSMPTTISDMHDALRHQLRKLLIDCATQKQDTLLPPLSQAKSDSDEDYEKRFLREILERFQTLPTHEKLGYI